MSKITVERRASQFPGTWKVSIPVGGDNFININLEDTYTLEQWVVYLRQAAEALDQYKPPKS